MATTPASLTGRARQLNAKNQNAGAALAVAERGYLLQHGEIVACGPSQPGLMRLTPFERRRHPDFDFPILSPQKSQTEVK